MPAKSKAQQMAAGAALAAKRGEAKVTSLKGASKEIVQVDEPAPAEGVRRNQAQGEAGARQTLGAASVGFRLRRAGGKMPSRR